MGDRGNVKVVDSFDGGAVFLYSHWGGTELPKVVQTVLSRKARWDDAPYLARMIFCEMVKGQEADETGFGISTGICDNEHPIVVVDCKAQEVRYEEEPPSIADLGESQAPPKVLKKWTFKEFCKETLPEDF